MWARFSKFRPSIDAVRVMARVWLLSGLLVSIGCQQETRTLPARPVTGWESSQQSRVGALRPRPAPKLLPVTHFASGQLQEQSGALEGAIEQYRQAIALNHDFIAAYERLGLLLDRLGRFDAAEGVWCEAISRAPDLPSLHNNLGFHFLLQRRYAEAATHFENALMIDPRYDRARINLGITLAQVNQTHDALELFRDVLPEAQAQYNLGLVHRQNNRYLEAQDAFQAALQADPYMSAARVHLDQLEPMLAALATAEPAEPPMVQAASTEISPPAPAEPSPVAAGLDLPDLEAWAALIEKYLDRDHWPWLEPELEVTEPADNSYATVDEEPLRSSDETATRPDEAGPSPEDQEPSVAARSDDAAPEGRRTKWFDWSHSPWVDYAGFFDKEQWINAALASATARNAEPQVEKPVDYRAADEGLLRGSDETAVRPDEEGSGPEDEEPSVVTRRDEPAAQLKLVEPPTAEPASAELNPPAPAEQLFLDAGLDRDDGQDLEAWAVLVEDYLDCHQWPWLEPELEFEESADDSYATADGEPLRGVAETAARPDEEPPSAEDQAPSVAAHSDEPATESELVKLATAEPAAADLNPPTPIEPPSVAAQSDEPTAELASVEINPPAPAEQSPVAAGLDPQDLEAWAALIDEYLDCDPWPWLEPELEFEEPADDSYATADQRPLRGFAETAARPDEERPSAQDQEPSVAVRSDEPAAESNPPVSFAWSHWPWADNEDSFDEEKRLDGPPARLGQIEPMHAPPATAEPETVEPPMAEPALAEINPPAPAEQSPVAAGLDLQDLEAWAALIDEYLDGDHWPWLEPELRFEEPADDSHAMADQGSLRRFAETAARPDEEHPGAEDQAPSVAVRSDEPAAESSQLMWLTWSDWQRAHYADFFDEETRLDTTLASAVMRKPEPEATLPWDLSTELPDRATPSERRPDRRNAKRASYPYRWVQPFSELMTSTPPARPPRPIPTPSR